MHTDEFEFNPYFYDYFSGTVGIILVFMKYIVESFSFISKTYIPRNIISEYLLSLYSLVANIHFTNVSAKYEIYIASCNTVYIAGIVVKLIKIGQTAGKEHIAEYKYK